MNCQNCGAPAAGEGKFCLECGAPLGPAQTETGGAEIALTLEIIAGPGVGRSFPLGEVNRIGRGAENEIRLFDPEVSRSHAAVYSYEQGCAIHDLDSANGTYVNGSRISEGTWILPGDRIQMGSVLFQASIPGRKVTRTPDRSRPVSVPGHPRPAASGSQPRPAAVRPAGPPPVLLGALMLFGILLAAGGVVGLIVLFGS